MVKVILFDKKSNIELPACLHTFETKIHRKKLKKKYVCCMEKKNLQNTKKGWMNMLSTFMDYLYILSFHQYLLIYFYCFSFFFLVTLSPFHVFFFFILNSFFLCCWFLNIIMLNICIFFISISNSLCGFRKTTRLELFKKLKAHFCTYTYNII